MPNASTTRTATGPAVDYNYGVLSVSVTVTGKKITKVGIASLNDGGNFRSQSIDQQSIPILRAAGTPGTERQYPGRLGRDLHERRVRPIPASGTEQVGRLTPPLPVTTEPGRPYVFALALGGLGLGHEGADPHR